MSRFNPARGLPLELQAGHYLVNRDEGNILISSADFMTLRKLGAYDSFDRVDGPLGNADTEQEWSVDFGSLEISSGRVRAPAVSTSNMGSLETGISDGIFSLIANVGTASLVRNVGIVFRMVDAGNLWVARIHRDAVSNSTRFQLARYNDGTATVVSNINRTINANTDYLIKVITDGPIIRAFLDGDLVASISSTQHMTGTKAGVRFAVSDTPMSSWSADNFMVEAI